MRGVFNMLDRSSADSPRVTFRRDYRPSEFVIPRVRLRINLDAADTHVEAELDVARRVPGTSMPLVLDGRNLTIDELAIDGVPLPVAAFKVDADSLTILDVPDDFRLTIHNKIRPRDNTALTGLYVSNGIFCTQCEAEGFRRITYFLDRPDVLSVYTTTLEAKRSQCPVLLSNGNLQDQGSHDDGRHWATWHDPFPKPSYLFALVAGDLGRVSGEFTTRSNRSVGLDVYAECHNIDKCDHALECMSKAMAWDETAYGREYDLERYIIVAVDDFNMGAMENKGLNIFNSKYVLAKSDTATDADYESILGVIGHEYFHNWSGNRVTCRDWFQLSLKEGFTVFRDQQFSADMTSPGVKRIEDVNILRTYQFNEDSGPMAHPVRPESYVEINNFYTLTVYNKGAEVIRMLSQLLGADDFRSGTDLYFDRHDGQAVTTDDFITAMEDANSVDLEQFRLWYSQAGTPEVTINSHYDADDRSFTLNTIQSCPATPGQREKQPFHIPMALALLDSSGKHMALQLEDKNRLQVAVQTSRVFELQDRTHRFRFVNVPESPVLSVFRNFSAPVKWQHEATDAELRVLLAHDSDPFSRWEAGQRLFRDYLLQAVAAQQQNLGRPDSQNVLAAIRMILQDALPDPALAAHLLALPSEIALAEAMHKVDPDSIHLVRRRLKTDIATELRTPLRALYQRWADPGPYRVDQVAIGRRALRNLCLEYLVELDDDETWALCQAQFESAHNMTDQIAALRCFANSGAPKRESNLADFYAQWRHESLVLDKWLAIQATARRIDTLQTVRSLTAHAAFSKSNPNKIRALIGAFSAHNPVRFHAADGQGYKFLADWVVTLDATNPQVAARLVAGFLSWRRYDEDRQAAIVTQLERIAGISGLSVDVYEVVHKALSNN